MAAIQCARCGLFVPDTALQCDCGYNFQTRQVGTPNVEKRRPQRGPAVVPYLKGWLIISFVLHGGTALVSAVAAVGAGVSLLQGQRPQGNGSPINAGDIQGVIIVTAFAIAYVAKLVSLAAMWRLRTAGVIGSIVVNVLVVLGGSALDLAVGEIGTLQKWTIGIYLLDSLVTIALVRDPYWIEFK